MPGQCDRNHNLIALFFPPGSSSSSTFCLIYILCSLKGPVSIRRKAHAAIHDKKGVTDMDYTLIPPKPNLFPRKPAGSVYLIIREWASWTFQCLYLSRQAEIHDSVYALTQVRGLAEVDMTQAPLRKFICHLSMLFQSLPVALDGNALQCTPLQSPQAQNRGKETWYANRHVCRAKQCFSMRLCAF